MSGTAEAPTGDRGRWYADCPGWPGPSLLLYQKASRDPRQLRPGTMGGQHDHRLGKSRVVVHKKCVQIIKSLELKEKDRGRRPDIHSDEGATARRCDGTKVRWDEGATRHRCDET